MSAMTAGRQLLPSRHQENTNQDIKFIQNFIVKRLTVLLVLFVAVVLALMALTANITYIPSGGQHLLEVTSMVAANSSKYWLGGIKHAAAAITCN